MFESLLFLGAEAGAGAGEKTRSLSRSKTDQLRNTAFLWTVAKK